MFIYSGIPKYFKLCSPYQVFLSSTVLSSTILASSVILSPHLITTLSHVWFALPCLPASGLSHNRSPASWGRQKFHWTGTLCITILLLFFLSLSKFPALKKQSISPKTWLLNTECNDDFIVLSLHNTLSKQFSSRSPSA